MSNPALKTLAPQPAPYSPELWWNAVFKSALDPKFLLNGSGRILAWNSEAEKIFGRTSAEVLGRALWDPLLTPHGLPNEIKLRTLLQKSSEKPDSAVWDKVVFAHPSGDPLEVLLVVRSLPTKEGTLLVATIRNSVSDNAIKHTLKVTEKFLEKSQEVANIGSWIVHLDEGTLIWSRETYRIMDLEPTTFILTLENFFARVHPEDRAALEAHYYECLHSNKPYWADYRILTSDGQVRWVHQRGEVIRDKAEKPLRFLGVLQDISERKRSEERLLESQETLLQVQKLESLGLLAGGIAHDFNNLLAAILGYSSILNREMKDNPKASEKLAAIIQSASRGAELTKQLLGFARKGKYLKKVVEVGSVMEEAKNVLFRSIDKRITVHSTSTIDCWPIEADSTQLFQVLMNLGLNARDAMPNGGELYLSAGNEILDARQGQKTQLRPGPYTCIFVRDTGTGISKQDLGKIFDPFFTTKEVGKGTGLGLAMVYGIMKNHDGAVTVDSVPGKGTAFTLYFPAMALTPPLVSVKNEEFLPAGSSWLKDKTVLIIDDEPLLRSLAKEILEPLGAAILVAEDGEKGLDAFRANAESIDAVVLDVGMPKLNGIETYKQLRKMNAKVRVVFATGYADNTEIFSLLADDTVRFVEKPYSAAALLKCLTEPAISR